MGWEGRKEKGKGCGNFDMEGERWRWGKCKEGEKNRGT